ncbi:MAG: hypothetical protein KAR84_06855 [Elusimicrobiales bacterium]|nr:hypothetical protein [Elusimicrobiales bacterium]
MIKRFKTNIFLLIGLFSCGSLFTQAGNIDYKSADNNLVDPVYQDYISTVLDYSTLPIAKNPSDFRDSLGPIKKGLKNYFLTSNKNGLYSAVIKPRTKRKTEEKVKSVIKVVAAKTSSKKTFFVNPLFYKVKFANEAGRIDSRVLPLDFYNAANHMNYVFIQILFRGEDSSDFVDKIAEEAFFKFAGERKVLSKTGKTEKILILGWVPYNGFETISKKSEVVKVSFEKSKIDFSAMTDISFVLKLPYRAEHSPFISSFLEDISKKTGFMLNKTAPIKQNYSIMLVTGKVPIDKIRNVYQSPFVIQVKLTEQSI